MKMYTIKVKTDICKLSAKCYIMLHRVTSKCNMFFEIFLNNIKGICQTLFEICNVTGFRTDAHLCKKIKEIISLKNTWYILIIK